MFLIIGLGNPGEQFQNTRHNIGRETVIAFQKHARLCEWMHEKKYRAQLSEGTIGKEKIIIAIPDTLMNASGHAVAPLVKALKVKPVNLIVIHDDADLVFGAGKMSFGKRSAGHKGVESVIRALATRDFWRIRIGIGDQRNTPAEKLVLRKFKPQELRLVKRITQHAISALELITAEGPRRAMTEYNKK